jgi:ribonuclease Z
MNFSVTILGANSAKFAHGRHQTSQLVNHNENLFLVDCSEGTQMQLMRYRIKMSRINQIFVSHLHGDHFLGLMGIILTQHLNGRTQRLDLYGPPGLDELLTVQLRVSETALKYPLIANPIEQGPSRMVYENEHLEVHTIPLEHRINCNGFLFKEKVGKRRLITSAKDTHGLLNHQISLVRAGQDIFSDTGELLIDHRDVTLPPYPQRSYAYCSDTKFTLDPVNLVKGADLLYHEATFLSDMADRAETTFHSTAQQAATFAKEANVRSLVIGHFSSRYKDVTPFLEEAQATFINTRLAEEGVQYDIPYPSSSDEDTVNDRNLSKELA